MADCIFPGWPTAVVGEKLVLIVERLAVMRLIRFVVYGAFLADVRAAW
jgi:hypothetical protein